MIGNNGFRHPFTIFRPLLYAVLFSFLPFQQILKAPVFLHVKGIFLLPDILCSGLKVRCMERDFVLLQSVCENGLFSRTEAFFCTVFFLFHGNIAVGSHRNLVESDAVRGKIQILP